VQFKDKDIFCFLYIATKKKKRIFEVPTLFWTAQEFYEGSLFLASAPDNGPFNLLISAQFRRTVLADSLL